MINAIIIDDEQNSRELLVNMLEDYNENVKVLASAYDVPSGIEVIKKWQPDLVFLDIEMPGGSGFDILNAFSEINFKVIFVTGYDQYAIKAIKFAALDYLLKPIDLSELELAIQKVEKKQGDTLNSNVQVLKNNFSFPPKPMDQIVLPGHKKHKIVQLNDIVRIEAQGNYVIFHLEKGESHIATQALSVYEELLPAQQFFRIHKSYIINCSKVSHFDAGRGGKVHLNDGTALDIAARRKAAFRQVMERT